MSPTSYQAALPRVIPSLLSATLIIIPYFNGFVKRVRKVFLQQKQRMKTRLLTFFPESQQARQFTPLREGRRDAQAVRRLRTQFQFTPLREGRLDARPPDYVPELISIHAPPRGATAGSRPQPARRGYFNSRPSARGDGRQAGIEHDCGYFNSRPSARGDDDKKRRDAVVLIFQFTPLREGRRYFDTVPHKATKFQFTPLREGRQVSIMRELYLLAISIHAPPRGATPNHAGSHRFFRFQFTPLREGRRDDDD